MQFQRTFALGKRKRAASDGDLTIELALASEDPYERWWGIEVLDCSSQSVRLDRLNNGASVLFNHDMDELRGTHVPGTCRCDRDGVVRAEVRLESVTQCGKDTIALVESGVLTKVSTGYQIHAIIEQTTTKSGARIERHIDGATFARLIAEEQQRCGGRGIGDRMRFRRQLDQAIGAIDIQRDAARAEADAEPVYRVVDWEPFETSLVTVPADDTVGVGRASQPRLGALQASAQAVSQPAAPAASQKESANMPDDVKAAAGASAENQQRGVESQAKQGPTASELDAARVRAIDYFSQANKIGKEVRDHWVATGATLEQVGEDILRIVAERSKGDAKPASELGLSEKEKREFSIARMILAVRDKDFGKVGFEIDCSREIAKRLGTVPDPTKFYVPFDVQQRSVEIQRRDLTAATAGAGGFLVATQNVGFIDLLRNRSVAMRMGAMRLSGLTSNVTVPRQSAAATAFWLSTEATAITESQQTFVQMALAPKNVGAYTEISRQLLLQSNPAAEAIVTTDLAAQVALAADLAALAGSGASGQPTGITNTAGVGSVTGTSIAFAGILEFQSDIATANVMPARGGYVTTPSVAALLIQRVKYTSTASPLWEGNVWDGQMQGFPAMSSNQMPAATMIFGDWSQLVLGEWGTLEIEVNPYANFQAGIIGVRAIYTMDVGVRIPAAFSVASSIT